MPATRHILGSTTASLTALVSYIRKGDADVRLFASHREEVGGFDNEREGANNIPLVSAIVHDGVRWIVFDGNFLNAVRGARFAEVSELLDAAVDQGSVHFCKHPVDFTSGMGSDAAADYLSSLDTETLTKASRINYARLMTLVDAGKL